MYEMDNYQKTWEIRLYVTKGSLYRYFEQQNIALDIQDLCGCQESKHNHTNKAKYNIKKKQVYFAHFMDRTITMYIDFL